MFDGGRSPYTLGGKLMRLNWGLLLAVAILAGIGTGVLTSVNGGSFQPWAERHAMRFLVGAGLVIVMALVPPRIWLRLAYPAYGIGIVLLALVPVMGVEALGAKRWLAVAGTTFQPSEVVKIALVAALARFYQTLKSDRVSSPGWVLVPLLMIFVPVVLTLRQPDLGTAVLFAATGLVMMFLAGVHAGYYAVGAVAAVAAVPLVLSRLHGYQRKRLEVFLDPDKDPLGAGYHITQAKTRWARAASPARASCAGHRRNSTSCPRNIRTSYSPFWARNGASWAR
jgi:rod shape determining protein RodA